METDTSLVLLGGLAIGLLLLKGDEGEGVVPLWEKATPEEYRDLVRTFAEKHHIPAELIVATVIVESHWDPNAKRYEPKLGEYSMGLGQILPSTARLYGYQGETDWLLGAFNNLDWTAYILRQLWSLYDNVTDVVAAYNAGTPRRKADGTYINQAHVSKVMKQYMSLLG